MIVDTPTTRIVIGIAIAVAAGIFTQLWAKYRNRVAQLWWTSQYTSMAVAEENDEVGRVEVLFNGDPVKNLFIGTFQIQNASSSDLTDVQVDFRASNPSFILHSVGRIVGTFPEFPYTPAFVARAQNCLQDPDSDPRERQFLGQNRQYLIPVLNRDTTTHFGFLLTRADGGVPDVSLSCVHTGVKLIHRPLEERFLGVRQRAAQAAGLLTGFAVIGLSWRVGSAAACWAYVGWIIGIFALHLGAGVVQLASLLRRLAR